MERVLSIPSNLPTKISKQMFLLISRSIDKIAMLVSRCSVMVLLLGCSENERSHWALLTANVKLIIKNFSRLGMMFQVEL